LIHWLHGDDDEQQQGHGDALHTQDDSDDRELELVVRR